MDRAALLSAPCGGRTGAGEVPVYEHHSEPVLPREAFLRRVSGHLVISLGMVALSLAIGTAGYHWFGRLPWIDAFENASMILTGMGPVDSMDDDAAKIFASLYALYSGIVFLVSVGVLAAPFLHRIMHRLHVED